MVILNNLVLTTEADGHARFRQEPLALDQGTPAARLSALLPAGAVQFRHSPVGFHSDFHCTATPQWLFVLQGRMEIGLQDGSWHAFKAGDYFLCADTLPAGASFDPRRHGHRSRQAGDQPLVTAFVRVPNG